MAPPVLVAVIGAGASGITAAKTCLDHRVHVTVFEQSDVIGGNWVYREKSGHPSVYRSTYINTSKELMTYSDFEMPDGYPDYPHHSQIARYFEEYVDRFGVREHIRFNTKVVEVRPENRDWIVVTEGGEQTTVQAVLVANGHHWDPSWPCIPGEFKGEIIHSHDYRTPAGFEGKRVLILGLGNSGVDISTELSRVSADVAVSMRRGVQILPKYIRGIPIDHIGLSPLTWFLPRKVNWFFTNLLVRSIQGDVTRFGLPKATQGLFSTHPTVSSEFLGRVGHGTIRIKPNIERLDGGHVLFSDGSREPFDKIIYATGYKISFPFLDASVFSAPDNHVRLYKYVVHPRRPGLFFIGLVQPWGSIMPISEMQSQWVCRILTGTSALPSPERMEQDIERVERRQRARYVDTPRHTIQVDHFDYMRELYREMVPRGWAGIMLRLFRIVDPFTRTVWRRLRRYRRRQH